MFKGVENVKFRKKITKQNKKQSRERVFRHHLQALRHVPTFIDLPFELKFASEINSENQFAISEKKNFLGFKGGSL